MKIMAIADEADSRLWENLDKTLLEGVDLILAAGDLPAQYLSFITCFTHAPVLYVHGNHDERYADNPPLGCECIDDDIVCINGLRILGLGGSMRYRDGKYMHTEKEMRKRIRKLRFKLFRNRGFDILLTHAPMKGYGDQEDLPHRGFACFEELIKRYSPKYMIYGHVHPGYGKGFVRTLQYNSTTLINANKRVMLEIPVPADSTDR